MLGRRMTEDRRRTIDEKCEVQALLAGEAAVGEAAVGEVAVGEVAVAEAAIVETAVAEAAAVETALESVGRFNFVVLNSVKLDIFIRFTRKMYAYYTNGRPVSGSKEHCWQ